MKIERLRTPHPPARRRILGAMAAAVLVSAAALPFAAAAADDWPSKPIEVVVGFNPGGGTDLIGRAIAAGLEKQLGVPVQVVNRAGGGGVVGFDALRMARPDGYTAGIITAQVITANLRGVMQATYEDFTLVAMLNIDYSVIAVPAASPFQTFEDFIEAARANPGAVTVANGGEGGSYHMMARNIEEAAGITVKHIPFDGGPAAILQLIGGHVQAAAVGAIEIAPQVEAGAARVLAVAGQVGDPRVPEFPDAPTSAELGIPLQIGTWRAIGMPKGVDPEIVKKFDEAVAAASRSPEFIDAMEKAKAPIRYFGPDELLEYVTGQEEIYRKILN